MRLCLRGSWASRLILSLIGSWFHDIQSIIYEESLYSFIVQIARTIIQVYAFRELVIWALFFVKALQFLLWFQWRIFWLRIITYRSISWLLDLCLVALVKRRFIAYVLWMKLSKCLYFVCINQLLILFLLHWMSLSWHAEIN